MILEQIAFLEKFMFEYPVAGVIIIIAILAFFGWIFYCITSQ